MSSVEPNWPNDRDHLRMDGRVAPDLSSPADAPNPSRGVDVGPHDLIITAGDCAFYGACSCGVRLGGRTRPDESFNIFGQRWERHVMAAHRGCDCEPCSW